MAEGRLESIDGGVSPCAQVANGVAAVVAIQAAGLAVSQALWSGLSVFVSFLWGALVFREPIAHPRLAIAGAALGCLCLTESTLGHTRSYYSYG